MACLDSALRNGSVHCIELSLPWDVTIAWSSSDDELLPYEAPYEAMLMIV